MLTIQQVELCVRHIKGEDNVAADLLSRWANPHYEETQRDFDIEAALIEKDLKDADIDMNEVNLDTLQSEIELVETKLRRNARLQANKENTVDNNSDDSEDDSEDENAEK